MRYWLFKSEPDAFNIDDLNVEYLRPTHRNITLSELKTHAQLRELALLKKENHLSIIPINKQQWHFILSLESNQPPLSCYCSALRTQLTY